MVWEEADRIANMRNYFKKETPEEAVAIEHLSIEKAEELYQVKNTHSLMVQCPVIELVKAKLNNNKRSKDNPKV